MDTLFDAATRSRTLQRIERLRADSPRQWGKMDAAQMLAHCSVAFELATGDRGGKQMLIGKLLSPFVRKGMLGDKPFPKDSPTAPVLTIKDARAFGAEQARLEKLVMRFGEGGPAGATRNPHLFFGPLTGEQWGALMTKHLEHHLKQFGV